MNAGAAITAAMVEQREHDERKREWEAKDDGRPRLRLTPGQRAYITEQSRHRCPRCGR